MRIFCHLDIGIQEIFQCHAVLIQHQKGVAIETQDDVDFLLLAVDQEIQRCPGEHLRKEEGLFQERWLIARSRRCLGR